MAKPDEVYFWATHSGAEIDCIVLKNGRMTGIECKRSDAPKITASMHSALDDLSLNRLLVIYAGDRSFPLTKNITAVAFKDIIEASREYL